VRDIEAGRNAGMRTAVAGWGYLNDDEDPPWGADLHFDTVQALHHWLRYELS
jgi:phosphoglycolate phosphatase